MRPERQTRRRRRQGPPSIRSKMKALIPGVLWVFLLVCGGIQPMDGLPSGLRGNTKENINLQHEFSNSLKLSRKILSESKTLAHNYKILKLPGTHLDFTRAGHGFPSLSISSSDWFRLQKGERLRLLDEALRFFPAFLEELEKWETQEGSFQMEEKEPFILSDRINTVRLDLRDLLQHIQLQMTSLGVQAAKPSHPCKPPTNGSEWSNRVLMYQVLRSLEKSLHRAVREYTMLRLTSV